MNYLTKEEALRIHEIAIGKGKGTDGIRDEGLLISAINRPRNRYCVDAIDAAAALWESLMQNPPFVDGNKRTAFFATKVFLRMNGMEIQYDNEDVCSFIKESYEQNEMNHKNIEKWLREHIKK